MRLAGRTPHGVRGLKCQRAHTEQAVAGRTPHGVRGLKYVLTGFNVI